jgi:hypothetical protein
MLTGARPVLIETTTVLIKTATVLIKTVTVMIKTTTVLIGARPVAVNTVLVLYCSRSYRVLIRASFTALAS